MIFSKEVSMPRRERERELARKRKRSKERKKLRAKGLLGQPVETVKESEKKKLEKGPADEAPKENLEKPPSES